MNKQEQELVFKIKQVEDEIKKSSSKYFKKDRLKYLKKLKRELVYYRKHFRKE